MSGACPECGRAFQRLFVSEVMDLASYENSLATHRGQHRLPPPPLGGRQARHAQHDQNEAGRDRDYQRFRPYPLDGWRHRPQPQRRHPEKCAHLLAGPVVRIHGSIQPQAILQVAARYVQEDPEGEATYPNRGMRRLIPSNLLRIQDGFRPAHRLPRASWTTWKPPNMLENPESVTATHRACQGDAVAPQGRTCGSIVPPRRAYDTEEKQCRPGQNQKAGMSFCISECDKMS